MIFTKLQTLLGRSEKKLVEQGPNVGILLAAGRGARFDPTGQMNKLLAEIDGLSCITQSLSTMTNALDEVLMVVRRGGQREVLESLAHGAGAKVEICEDASSGMGHSIAWGVAAAVRLYGARTVTIGLGDMPFVLSTTVSKLVSNCRYTHEICVPTYRGEWGNPVTFGSEHFAALGQLKGDRGARSLINQLKPTLIEVEDPGILRDIDKPTDLVQDH